MFVLFFVIVAAILTATILRKLIGPIMIIAAVIFVWGWLHGTITFGN